MFAWRSMRISSMPLVAFASQRWSSIWRGRNVQFDAQGHVLLSPRHVQDGLADCDSLVNRWLLPGTPLSFDTHDNFHRFLSFIADELYIPPMNVCVRGSGKIGFSIAPRDHKLWMAPRADADVDVGIVDVDYFNVIDRELKRWVRKAPLTVEARKAARKINKTRSYDYFRYFDLPETIPVVAQHNDCFRRAGDVVECVRGRVVTAFIFRDWWSVCRRYKWDLQLVKEGLARNQNPLPAAQDNPRPYEPPPDDVEDDD
jgi:hypothetical protein